ncbi:Eukaryotic peptide chain release factor subunit 1-2 [Acorus gramineus]|uniref:Eukaryotic peptide chain release factor subunit 1-2 n=1 Tax=Acorus gramineus TaxID=55184 RepID=A0AAV9AHV6_ACOGR|nr:Eukaryotic peptide chain release factor subunit 1-2 [Acorus gramineus]
MFDPRLQVKILNVVDSQEVSQFYRGLGGIGGILCYQFDMRSFDEASDEQVYEDSD